MRGAAPRAPDRKTPSWLSGHARALAERYLTIVKSSEDNAEAPAELVAPMINLYLPGLSLRPRVMRPWKAILLVPG